ncbi:MAG: hypothetical protein ACTHNU_06520 [Gaiellales bacterium]
MDRRRLTPILVALAIIVAGAGYWAVKVRQRADAATVTSHVAAQNPPARVRCVELQSNASAWVCAVVYQAEYLCVRADVSFTGSISEGPGRHRCDKEPDLVSFVPRAPTATAVAADVTRTVSGPRFTCVRPGRGTSRWLCGRRTGGAVDCRQVAVLKWQPLKIKPGLDACLHQPALRLGT